MSSKTCKFCELFHNFNWNLKTSKPWKYQFSLWKNTIFKVFANFAFLLFSCIFGFKNLPKTLPKRSPNPSKIDAENVLFFNIGFWASWPRFWSLLGLQDGAKLGSKSIFHLALRLRCAPRSDFKLDVFKTWRLGAFQPRFGRLQGSILEPPKLDFNDFFAYFGQVPSK